MWDPGRGGDELRGPAHAGRPVPAATRRAACCPAPGGLGLRRSARETSAGAARRLAPREFRTAGAGHGGLQVGVAARQLTGSARARLSAPGATVRGVSAAARPDFRGFPWLAGALGSGYPEKSAQAGLFFFPSLVKCDSARSIWLLFYLMRGFFLHLNQWFSTLML